MILNILAQHTEFALDFMLPVALRLGGNICVFGSKASRKLSIASPLHLWCASNQGVVIRMSWRIVQRCSAEMYGSHGNSPSDCLREETVTFSM